MSLSLQLSGSELTLSLDISTNLLQAPLLHLEQELSCPMCQRALRDRVTTLVRDWASVKVFARAHHIYSTTPHIVSIRSLSRTIINDPPNFIITYSRKNLCSILTSTTMALFSFPEYTP